MNSLPSRKWLGVSVIVSLMSQLTWVSGIETVTPSESSTIVEKDPWKICPIRNLIEQLV